MALFVGLWLSSIQQLSGVNGVLFDSNNIFKDGRTGLDAEKAARIGTFFIGITGFLGTGLSLITAKFFWRKLLLIIGVTELLFNLAFLGVWCIYKWTEVQIIATNLYMFVFNASLWPCFWVYASEILPSNGMSLVASINLIWATFFGAFINQMFKLLTSSGVFFTLAGIQVFALLFIIIFVKETKGKSKEELQTLYSRYKPLYEDDAGKFKKAQTLNKNFLNLVSEY